MLEKGKWSKHAITTCKQYHSSSSTRSENGVIRFSLRNLLLIKTKQVVPKLNMSFNPHTKC